MFEDKDLVEKAVIEAIASVELEGKKIPEYIKTLLYKYTKGEITKEEYDKLGMAYVMNTGKEEKDL